MQLQVIPTKTRQAFLLFHAGRIHRPHRFPRSYHANGISWVAQSTDVITSQFSPLHCSSYIFGSRIFSSAPSQHSSLKVTNHVSHPYKTSKIIVLSTWIFICFESEWWEKIIWSEMQQDLRKFNLFLISSMTSRENGGTLLTRDIKWW
jgi:hypothetical protein